MGHCRPPCAARVPATALHASPLQRGTWQLKNAFAASAAASGLPHVIAPNLLSGCQCCCRCHCHDPQAPPTCRRCHVRIRRAFAERTVALLVFEDVKSSPLADLMDVAQRQKTASELNAAILASQSQVGWCARGGGSSGCGWHVPAACWGRLGCLGGRSCLPLPPAACEGRLQPHQSAAGSSVELRTGRLTACAAYSPPLVRRPCAAGS